jgi:hypothetical protein
MLGRDYRGYFAPGDASGLAARLVRAWEERAFLRALGAQCERRRKLFSPATEARAVGRMVAAMLLQGRD